LLSCGGNKSRVNGVGNGTDGGGGSGGSATGGTGGSGGSGGSATGGTGGEATGGTGGSATGGTGGEATGGTGGSATGGTGGGSATDGGSGSTDGGTTTPVPITCEGIENPQCNDGLDNDMDGLVDSADGECVALCDNDEASYATGIPGDNMDACKQDCFFDGNSGQGDDGCNWDLRCDPANPGATAGCAYEADRNCQDKQSDKCTRNCRRLTPNGCDCFGCCTVSYGAGETANVRLVTGCTADKFGDPTVCPRCTQNTECVNTCEPCEVCVGRPAPDPSCGGGGGTTDGGTGGGDTDGGTSSGGPDAPPPPQCPDGMMSCGPTGQVPYDGCGSGFYCQTGCCVRFVID
jgi:hypothetical protein